MHDARCSGPPCQAGERVIKEIKIPIASVVKQDGEALSQQIWEAFRREKVRCPRCTQNMQHKIGSVAVEYHGD